MSRDTGGVTAELVVATPVALLLILIIVQFGVWQHAAHIADTVAAQSLAVTRAYGSSAAAGHAQAILLIGQLGLRQPRVHISRTDVTARVEVTGVAQSVVPFVRLPVRAVAFGPVERFSGR